MIRNHNIDMKINKGNTMGKLIIDGNSFFEIDEECVKKKKISKECDLDKYLNEPEGKKKVRSEDIKKKYFGQNNKVD